MALINISGNLESLKESVLNEIQALYDIETDRNDFLPEEVAERIADLTERINREIAVYINRRGNIVDISVGDSGTVSLPQVSGRRDSSRLSGIRCIHTHPNGDSMLSAVDINSLINLRLDAMAAVGVRDGKVNGVCVAVPVRDENGEFSRCEVMGPYHYKNNQLNSIPDMVLEREKSGGSALYSNEDDAERAILVGLESSAGKILNGMSEGQRSLEELEELAFTAGAVVLQKVIQRKQVRDPAFYIGKGKVEELGLIRQALNASLIIFDGELSGAQVRNIEEVTGTKVIDRTTLILDIFAQRARSKEGKLQVELAQLNYRLPRLMGMGNQLSRLGGGIGTRGPGEKKLEVDRRHIRRRINFLETELRDIIKRRGLMREGRKNNSTPTIALVGYTNVGKSTLLNKLCNADVFAENKLFATLDPTTRSFTLSDGRNALITDTVGFIRKLPHDLVDAFKSTLEETLYADVLMHVVDVSSEEAGEQVEVVNELLRSLGALNKPVVMVLNKIDRVDHRDRTLVPDPGELSFEVSAVTGQGLDELVNGLEKILPKDEIEVEVTAPYSEGWIVPYLHQNGKVLSEDYTENGALIKAQISKTKIEKIKDYIKQ